MTAPSLSPEFKPVNMSESIDIQSPLPWGRAFFSGAMNLLAFTFTGLAILPLFAILFSILVRGLDNLSWEALTSLPAPIGLENEMANGFANAILGTLLMVAIAAAMSVPFGVMTGIYLSEFGQGSRLASTVRFMTKILSSVPSIMVGVFAYGVVVLTTKRFSAVGGGFALAVLMVPIIALTTEEALKLVPRDRRLASLALGANRFQTTWRIALLGALPGITTGVLLAIARAAGETAPLLFTALFSETWPQGLFQPTPSLAVLIYNYALSPFDSQTTLAWTAALVLLILVLTTNILSRIVTRRHT